MTSAVPPTTRATIGSLLLILPVSAELLWPSIDDSRWGHLLFACSQLVGWGLLATVCLGITAVRPAPVTGRAGRVGRGLVLTGCALQLLFALAYGASAVVMGEPLEASFVLFLLGFLALLVGGTLWGRALWREPRLRLAGGGFLATAVLGFLAIAVGADPFHDIALLGSYASWMVIGLGLERAARGADQASASVSA